MTPDRLHLHRFDEQGIRIPTLNRRPSNGYCMEIKPTEEHEVVACVLQNDRLFAGTIAQNIAGFGRPLERRGALRIDSKRLLINRDRPDEGYPVAVEDSRACR